MRHRINEYSIMSDYVAGIETPTGLVFPTDVELAKKYNITERDIIRMRKKYGETWDNLRAKLMGKGFEIAFRRMPIAKIEKLEDSFMSMIESLGKLFDGYSEKIVEGTVEVKTIDQFLKVVEMLSLLKEKKAGKDPNSMFGTMINAIWDKVADRQETNVLEIEGKVSEE